MRAVIQRVSSASVTIEGQVHGAIDNGLLVLLGIAAGDTEQEAAWLCRKIVSMRILSDSEGKMNEDILQQQGDILLISQFTLLAAAKKGNRPSYIRAARPEAAVPLYEYCIAELQTLLGKPVATGIFGADMKVRLINDGPVTIILDTEAAE